MRLVIVVRTARRDGLAAHPVVAAHAAKQRPEGVARGVELGAHAPHDGRPEVGDGAPALLIRLRAPDPHKARAIIERSEIGQVDGRDLRNAQHRVARKGDDSGIAQSGRRAIVGACEGACGVGLRPGDAGDLAAAPILAFAAKPLHGEAGFRPCGVRRPGEPGDEANRGEARIVERERARVAMGSMGVGCAGSETSDKLKPRMNGRDVTRRPADKWIVDFGWTMDDRQAALYEAPFQHVQQHVYPARLRNRRES